MSKQSSSTPGATLTQRNVATIALPFNTPSQLLTDQQLFLGIGSLVAGSNIYARLIGSQTIAGGTVTVVFKLGSVTLFTLNMSTVGANFIIEFFATLNADGITMVSSALASNDSAPFVSSGAPLNANISAALASSPELQIIGTTSNNAGTTLTINQATVRVNGS